MLAERRMRQKTDKRTAEPIINWVKTQAQNRGDLTTVIGTSPCPPWSRWNPTSPTGKFLTNQSIKFDFIIWLELQLNFEYFSSLYRTSKTPSATDSDTVNMLKQAAAAAAAMGNPLLGRSPAAAGTGSTSVAASSEADMMATLLKTNPALMLNPALFNLNPSMYAAQLAQLQLMSQLHQGNNSGGGGSVEAMRRLASASSAFGPSEQSDLGNPLAQVRKRKYEDADEHSPAASAAASAAALAGVLNLSAASAPAKSPSRLAESPLDLSGSKKHGFPDLNLSPGGHAKIPKLANADNDKLSAALGAWPFLHPLLASGSLTPEALAKLQFGMPGMLPTSMASAATPTSSAAGAGGLGGNPLERMSEIAKGSQSPPVSSSQANANKLVASMSTANAAGSRPSAWQSQWLNRGPESNKDIFKCVWCKEAFSSLQSLTAHMKETKHFGGSIPPSPTMPPTPTAITSRPPIPSPSPIAMRSPQPQASSPGSGHSGSGGGGSQGGGSGGGGGAGGMRSRDILKEQLPMPRKLVRGQDVWLGRGEQQTRDILKCMWCGESFRSLDIMTKHMQETKHYTKVISQEQLMSWKSPESSGSGQNHVNAVLTCKVCEEAFSTLKDLSEHMVKNNHYKQEGPQGPQQGPPGSTGSPAGGPAQQLSRAGSVSPRGPGMPGAAAGLPPAVAAVAAAAAAAAAAASNQQQSKEKRKKSLPVRKLLELERAQQEMSGQIKPNDPAGRIACEKCGDKILMHLFVDHIRQCVGPSLIKASSNAAAAPSMADLSRLLATSVAPPASMAALAAASTRTPSVSPPSLLSKKPVASSPRPPSTGAPATGTPAGAGLGLVKPEDEGPKSILGSLEKMVANNFGAKKKVPDSHMSILQRLGIDEGVDYNKPLMDPMAMFRSPQQMAAAMSAAAASGGQGFPHGFFPGGPPFSSSAASTTTHSNSSECSSPDRFRPSADRPSSTKSAASAKSPAPDEVPLAASVTMKKPTLPSSKLEHLLADDTKEEIMEESESTDKTIDGPQADTNADVDVLDASTGVKRRGRSASRKEPSNSNNSAEDVKREASHSPTPSKSSDVDSHLQRSPLANEPAKSPKSTAAANPGDKAAGSPVPGGNNDGHTSDVDHDPDVESENEGQPKTGLVTPPPATSTPGATGEKKKNSHPLAALQMLCDNNEKKSRKAANTQANRGSDGNGSAFGPSSDPGAILAFSWACNQAVVNDSLLKCPFCDTPFISKGAYRHHLSKMHFVKDGGMMTGAAMAAADTVKFLEANNRRGGGGAGGPPVSTAAGGSPVSNVGDGSESKEENAQSKFQKYSLMAKQLSCGSSQP